ncbi:MAG: pyridoxine 5'-phosphate synthase [Bacteroidales bacterium]|jgi:pyridoxine 5-phosphate synthase|nr:pyridoxine 5'-phosphate synthase [Bacteroidales bacterium]
MVKLSVNINKIATLRNARGGNMPDVVKSALKIEHLGADGITVHPRPDGRHIRYDDVRQLKAVLTKEFNIEGYPSEDFMRLVEEVKPTQITLVPDKPDALTSNNGWDTVKNESMLRDIVARLKSVGRVSLFVNADANMIEGAKRCEADRVELYTESYAKHYTEDKHKAIEPFIVAAKAAEECDLGVNAGHDLNYYNLNFFNKKIPNLLEVSIGHALICDALEFGMRATIQIYKRCLHRSQKYQNKHCLLTQEELNEIYSELNDSLEG